MGSLNTVTDIIQPLNSRLKYQTKKPFSWILAFTKAISVLSLPATHQGSIKASSKAKHLGCFELTLQEKLLKRTLDHSDHYFTPAPEVIQILW